jgi:hypothetical protein
MLLVEQTRDAYVDVLNGTVWEGSFSQNIGMFGAGCRQKWGTGVTGSVYWNARHTALAPTCFEVMLSAHLDST